MADAKKKRTYEKLVTPRGIAAWPKLDEPDMKFAKSGVGTYSIKYRNKADAIKAVILQIDTAHAAGLEAAKAEIKEKLANADNGKDKKKFKDALASLELGPNPVKVVADDDGEDTDEVELFFKMPAQVKNAKGKVFDLKPIVEDAKGGKIDPTEVQIWGGSTVRISAELRPYYNAATNNAGVSLRLVGVRVIELVSGGGNRDAGFGDAEEGYEGDPEAAKAPAKPDAEESSEDGEDF